MTTRSRLEQLGFDTGSATPEQIQAVASLTEEELGILLKVKRRFEEISGDVEGHSLDAGGVVW